MILMRAEMTENQRIQHGADLLQGGRRPRSGTGSDGKPVYGFGEWEEEGHAFEYPVPVWMIEGWSARTAKPAPMLSTGKTRRVKKA